MAARAKSGLCTQRSCRARLGTLVVASATAGLQHLDLSLCNTALLLVWAIPGQFTEKDSLALLGIPCLTALEFIRSLLDTRMIR